MTNSLLPMGDWSAEPANTIPDGGICGSCEVWECHVSKVLVDLGHSDEDERILVFVSRVIVLRVLQRNAKQEGVYGLLLWVGQGGGVKERQCVPHHLFTQRLTLTHNKECHMIILHITLYWVWIFLICKKVLLCSVYSLIWAFYQSH